MRKNILAIFGSMMFVVMLAACSSSDETPGTAQSTAVMPTASTASTDIPASATMPTSGSASMQVFTLEELAEYDGKDGQPAYVAVNGVVYDVTDVPQWNNGEHYDGLTAGQDLTEQITNDSPHGLSVLADLPVVGTLAK